MNLDPARNTAVADKGQALTSSPAENGVVFQERHDGRSSLTSGRAILAAAASATDPRLAQEITATENWRGRYIEHFAAITARGVEADAAVNIARHGLDAVHAHLNYRQGDTEVPLEAMVWGGGGAIEARTVNGERSPVTELRVPYRGKTLSGTELRDQLAHWSDTGTVEPGFVTAINRVIDEPELLRLPGRQFALLGAGAEMGPLEPFCEWGTDLLAIDIPNPRVSDRIEATARAGAGRVTVPVLKGNVGLDVLRDLRESAAWILSNATPGAALGLGMYGYADSGLHVRLSAAADALAAHLLSVRPDTALAYLGTPTDAYLVPAAVMNDAHRRWNARPRATAHVQDAIRMMSAQQWFRRAYRETLTDSAGIDWAVADIMLPAQGPNYALAKRIQRWRTIAATAQGHRVSFNVAPASWTRSVTSNRMFRIAYSGVEHFGVEVFAADTSRYLMAAKLAADLAEPAHSGHRHPEALISADANHGGLWRQPFEPKSGLTVAAAVGALSLLNPFRAPA
ncbi:hypothetical protein [Nocardia sp. NBC_00511]|uniref:hypothetical protein n=1 Tax=Nocardia sp. NBC_00511 TaxID=2903591 RepID=UPI0030E55E1F